MKKPAQKYTGALGSKYEENFLKKNLDSSLI